ncbi:hypothetical protein HMPREF9371_1418 [Neisseria shayeganii 871]|uniref:Uncharacterized protein n=1 Tax=Neisseria shayeganii 871 TaxID=1032488 RepID=G4CIF8_9NEIS|nr:hypothetical protein HMPREF9371_1418 [Neisseria shayeganii 871]
MYGSINLLLFCQLQAVCPSSLACLQKEKGYLKAKFLHETLLFR